MEACPAAWVSASHNVTGEPPSACIFLSLPSEKKAIHCPSGEKNGEAAPSVLGRTVGKLGQTAASPA